MENGHTVLVTVLISVFCKFFHFIVLRIYLLTHDTTMRYFLYIVPCILALQKYCVLIHFQYQTWIFFASTPTIQREHGLLLTLSPSSTFFSSCFQHSATLVYSVLILSGSIHISKHLQTGPFYIVHWGGIIRRSRTTGVSNQGPAVVPGTGHRVLQN